jgi:hypothetical protein
MFGIFIVYYDISIPTITGILYIQKIDYIWKKIGNIFEHTQFNYFARKK